MVTSSPLLVSPAMTKTLTMAVAVILLASNFMIINAQQQQTSQPEEIENGITAAEIAPTTFQSADDSFRVQVPDGWVIQNMNNTGSELEKEVRLGYGILAQLCTDEQRGVLSNATGSTNSRSSISNSNSCQGAQQELIHIVRYPDLDTRLQVSSNVTTNNITTDNVLSYHLQKLQEVGYRSIQIVNSTDMRLNLTNPQTNQTIATVPAKLVEMTYGTASAPNETRNGYLISTATNATPPNLGTIKGYAVFYEGNITTNAVTAETTTAAASGSLAPTPLPPAVVQVFDSFELIVAPEVAQALAERAAQAAETTEGGGESDEDEDDGDEGGDEGDDGGDGNGDDGERDDVDNGDGGNDGGDGDDDDGDNGGDDGDGDGDGDREGGPGLAERIIEETEEMAERIIGRQ
jgi:hypothetical protein